MVSCNKKLLFWIWFIDYLVQLITLILLWLHPSLIATFCCMSSQALLIIGSEYIHGDWLKPILAIRSIIFAFAWSQRVLIKWNSLLQLLSINCIISLIFLIISALNCGHVTAVVENGWFIYIRIDSSLATKQLKSLLVRHRIIAC